jgi:hypothetical protein
MTKQIGARPASADKAHEVKRNADGSRNTDWLGTEV